MSKPTAFEVAQVLIPRFCGDCQQNPANPKRVGTCDDCPIAIAFKAAQA